jgi:hypothetical protein
MSASQGHALSAIAFQLAAALEAYEEDIATMVRAPRDPVVYHRVTRRMDEMRMYAAAVPPVSVAWVEVMIRHFELTHGMWRQQKSGAEAADLAQLHANLAEAVLRLSRKCVQLMPAA